MDLGLERPHNPTEVEVVEVMRGSCFTKFNFLLLLTVLAACNFVHAQENEKSRDGVTIFKSKCVLCHGIDGTGNTTLGKQLQAGNLRSKEVQKLSDNALKNVVHSGKAKMPPFADQLSDDEIAHVHQVCARTRQVS